MATWGASLGAATLGRRLSAAELDDSSLGSILVSHDLQDCLDDSLDLPSFVKIYGQPAGDLDYAKYSDEDHPYGEALHDDGTGYIHAGALPAHIYDISVGISLAPAAIEPHREERAPPALFLK